MSNEATTPTPPPSPKGEDTRPFNEREVQKWYLDMLTGQTTFSAFVEQLNVKAFQYLSQSR
ncbi:hypothetical protein ACTJIJ_22905 [Niabella sp. 22666]|uniref:hypothetical protein n=1 Tax=Niabella sp. 22666 TaxID=3453954 RepID=UPI003F82A4DE